MGKRIMSLLAAMLLAFGIELPLFAAESAASPPSLYAEAAVLLDADTGQIIFQKNLHRRMYPASITKIMTCLLAMEEGNPSDLVTVTDEGVSAVPRNTTHIALTGGEQLTLEQLEYAMMVQSANDAANAIAIHLAGSMEAFAARMNERVAALGAVDTHFTNANGLPDPGHYTSAYDMGLITRAALSHPEFRRLAGTQKYEIPPTNKQKDTRYLANNQYMFTLNDTYPGAFAGKTGWTEEAGHTLVTIAEQNGVTLICIVLHSDAKGVLDCQFKDSTALLDYGFQNFRRVTVPLETLPTRQAEGGVLRAEEDLRLLLPLSVGEDAVSLSVDDEGRLAAAVPDGTPGLPKWDGGAQDTVLLYLPLALAESPQAVPTKAPEQGNRPSRLWPALLGWTCLALAALAAALLLLRMLLRRYFRYRQRKRRERELARRRAAQRRIALKRARARRAAAVDVTVDRSAKEKPKIKVIDVQDL